MKVLAREGNTRSPVIRNGWDGKRRQALVRNAPLRATAAHVAVVAHITKDELLRYLNATELPRAFSTASRSALSGAASCSRSAARSPTPNSTISRPSSPPRWRPSAPAASSASRTEARERSTNICEQLSAPQPGMFGAATGRAEAHTIRLALIYALLDSSPQVTRPHLDAAPAL